MKVTKLARSEARSLFRSCQVNGVLDENRARQAVRLLVERKPRNYMGVLDQFHKRLRLDTQRRTATIESASPLAHDFQERLRADLSRRYGGGLTFIFSQNEALLGGLRIRVGGDVYNGSVQARLAALQESF